MKLQELREVLYLAMSGEEIAGANLLVLKEGKEICYLEAGYANREEEIPIRRDSIFRLYSMTKPITAAAVLSLVEKGKLDLNEPVSKYLSGFRAQKKIENGSLLPVEREMRLVHLLSMTSGLVYDGATEPERETGKLFAEILERMDGERPMSTQEFANRLGGIPLAFEPGSSWKYGTSADVLGAVVELVSGMSLPDYLNQTFFEPLEMKDTGFFVPEEKQKRLVKAYKKDEKGGLSLYTGSHLGIQNEMKHLPAFASGGAGLVSTIDDYAAFASMLQQGGSWQGKRILRPRTVEFLTSARLNAVQKAAFGNWVGLEGFSYGNLMRVMQDCGQACLLGTEGEYGWDGWMGAYFSNHPKEKVSFLFLMNMPNAGTTSLVRKLKNIVISSLE
ncbi:MAG: serine hydrolase domain-containing protein [bacterium]|nr:serine hydrolase domain-containing protein [bacterium]